MLDSRIINHLSADDDGQFWEYAVATIFQDATRLCRPNRSNRPIFAQVGCCSHWMSPHNKGSWFKAAEKFAWPSGYGRHGSLIHGLPEFDWSVVMAWNEEQEGWDAVSRASGARHLLFRASLPARSKRHMRAVVHTLWTPGSPGIPDEPLLQAYAFKKTSTTWSNAAVTSRDEPYEVEEPP